MVDDLELEELKLEAIKRFVKAFKQVVFWENTLRSCKTAHTIQAAYRQKSHYIAQLEIYTSSIRFAYPEGLGFQGSLFEYAVSNIPELSNEELEKLLHTVNRHLEYILDYTEKWKNR